MSFGVIVIGAFVLGIIIAIAQSRTEPRPAMVCPHCQQRGFVRVRSVSRKAGISGGKATGAILTGGISLLATGLSRKETVTEASCSNCKSKWSF